MDAMTVPRGLEKPVVSGECARLSYTGILQVYGEHRCTLLKSFCRCVVQM